MLEKYIQIMLDIYIGNFKIIKVTNMHISRCKVQRNSDFQRIHIFSDSQSAVQLGSWHWVGIKVAYYYYKGDLPLKRQEKMHLKMSSAEFICCKYLPSITDELNIEANSVDPEQTVPGRVAQSVTCLATDACLTADPGVASSIPVRSHTFVEIDHEIISTVILLPSADLFKKGCCQLQAKVCAWITG